MPEITLNGYQDLRGKYTTYKGRNNQGLNYALMGLGGEVGELQNKFKKSLRTADQIDAATYDPAVLADELGDVLWYTAAVAQELGYSLQGIAEMNLAKLEQRRAERLTNGTGTSGSNQDNGGVGHCSR